jgi:hypothetical protein
MILERFRHDKIRNPNIEIRNNARMIQIQKPQTARDFAESRRGDIES